jgi:DNA invertase Pin-like site-specific DNA recombinase
LNPIYKIAAYTRISVDDDTERDNVSIENQKAVIAEFIQAKFPGCRADYYEDRDKSGYTFEQRAGYQAMRTLLLGGCYDILMIKDFSRFSRRNSKGLVELEDLRDAGIRIIAVTDGVDFPTNDDWLAIQFRFLMNELPVTDASKKVKTIIESRQKKGEWICNAPYGYYLHPTKKNTVCIDAEGAETVRVIFDLYNKGFGYKKISNYLTEHHYPTGFALMKKQLEEKGADASKIKANPVWSHISVAKILKNDFYIGTLRQNVWKRAGINKKDVRVDDGEHIVFENHHAPVIENEVFQTARENAAKRSVSHYKGVRKYRNPYSGVLFCDDCGSPMFSVSNPKRPPAYLCGAYHRLGRKGCTSHHIHERVIDGSVRAYIMTVRDRLCGELAGLGVDAGKEGAARNRRHIDGLRRKIADVKRQLTEATKQRVKEIARNPQNERLIAEVYDEIQKEFQNEIKNITFHIDYLSTEAEKKSRIKENINGVLEIFEGLIRKEAYDKTDVALIIERITVDQNKVVTVRLKSSIAELFGTIDSAAIADSAAAF